MSESIFNLPNSISCKKHPSKKIEYFCTDAANEVHLFCSSCIFKKDIVKKI